MNTNFSQIFQQVQKMSVAIKVRLKKENYLVNVRKKILINNLVLDRLLC